MEGGCQEWFRNKSQTNLVAENLYVGEAVKTLALPLCGFELDMEYKWHEAYQLQISQNPFLPFCYLCVYVHLHFDCIL